MGRNTLNIVVITALLLAIEGCSSYRHCQWRVGDQSTLSEQDYSLAFVEFDDEGWMWDRRQADAAVALIRKKAAERNTVVLLFVHGWHHSAECCDGNVEGFKHALSELNTHLRKSERDFNVVGLYVGWRGRSLPWILDYTTFWGRKGAAERIGENDMKEFIARLQEVYVEYRPDAGQARTRASGVTGTSSSPPERFFGMVLLGHSFGAQLLFKAIGGTLEDQFLRVNATPAYLRDAQPGTPDPNQPVTVTGVGDLVVLMNPALEASQYHRLDLLSRGLSYSSLQTPLILTVSSENDKARHRLFKWGRMAGEFFTGKPRKENEVQRRVEREALGVYTGHLTHELIPTDPSVELVAAKVPSGTDRCDNGNACERDWRVWKTEPTVKEPDSLPERNADPDLVRNFDFSCKVVFKNVQLSRLIVGPPSPTDTERDRCETAPFQPFIVARTSRNIIDDHSGIFTKPFLDFLVPYIRYIEIKSLRNRQDKQRAIQTQMNVIEEKRPGAAR